MPRYIYECKKCENQHQEIHGMSENPKIKCPECKGDCYRAIQPVNGFVRGNCYLNKKDCKKQSNLALLRDSDPYSKHRVPGETDDMINKIKHGGKGKKTVPINGLKKK